jgi:hypothetical protein
VTVIDKANVDSFNIHTVLFKDIQYQEKMFISRRKKKTLQNAETSH